MDSAEQADGEKRVKALLIDALERRGLAKPSSLTRAQYDEMVRGLCQKLAYMAEDSLAALEEQAAASPGGKDRDRMPIANLILEWAAQIQPPDDGASPLMRKVFAHRIGLDAIEEGWAPELLAYLRQFRRWPSDFAISQVRTKAGDAVRRMVMFDEKLARGGDLSADEERWRARRVAALGKCREISGIGG